jgi:hypothetical protein
VCRPTNVYVQAGKCLYLSLLVPSEAGVAMKISKYDVMLKVAVYSHYGLDGPDIEYQSNGMAVGKV